MGNRDFDWSEICCCHDNFITCHECNIVILFFVKLKGSAMILLSKLPVDGTRNGNDATQSACKPKQLWPSDCPPILKRTLCGFMASSLQPDDAPTTLYLASTTWMETPMHFELPSNRTLEFSGSRTVAVKSSGASPSFLLLLPMEQRCPQKSSSKASVHQEIWLCRIPFVFPSTRKGGWMNRASENGFDRVCHVLSVPFSCGTYSELT